MTLRALPRFGLLLPIMIGTLTACALQEGTRGASAPPVVRPASTGPAQFGPRLIVGQDGALNLFWMAVERRKSLDILYSRSEDQGSTWLEPAISLKPDKGTGGGGVDVAADSKGHLYAAWRQRDEAGKHLHLMLARSSDGGKSWSVPAKELASSPTIGFPYLLVDDDGGVHVAWLEGPIRGYRHLEFTTSRDFGETFASEPTRLHPADSTSKSGLINARIASDGTGRIYVVWEEDTNRQGASRIYLNRSTDHGRTWAEKPILVSPPEDIRFGLHSPQIVAVPGGRVAVMWEQFDERTITPQGGAPQTKIDRILIVNRSLDGGQSWLTKPIRLNAIDPAAPEAVVSVHGRFSADRQGNLYAVWAEAEGQQSKRLLLAHSSDFGSTWGSPPVQLERTSPIGAPPLAPMIRHDERGHVWILWQERSPQSDGWQILINGSEDSGRTWRRRALRVTGPAQPPETIRSTAFQSDGDGRLFVAYDEGQGSEHGIAVTLSADAGRTWLPQPFRIGQP